MSTAVTPGERGPRAGQPSGGHEDPLARHARAAEADLLRELDTTRDGLSAAERARRLRAHGPNAVRSHHARFGAVLARQLRSPLLALLVVTATVSFFLGERTDALIIGAIVTLSVGLGCANEYRAERAAEAMHASLRRQVSVRTDGEWTRVDVVDLAPGDVLRLRLGDVVPADVRLLDTHLLRMDESILTGESQEVAKSGGPGEPSECCAWMGTVARAGEGVGVVVATGPATTFGRIALSLGERQPETEFQIGLRRFSGLLVRVAAVLTGSIFVINLVLRRPVLDALLFSLAVAVGITPQLLPAVVSTSLATGSRRLAKLRVLVKRLVCIEDLGDVEVLFTDKTGTLTDGRLRLLRTLGPDGQADGQAALELARRALEPAAAGEVAGITDALDAAIRDAAGDALAMAPPPAATLPFDHARAMASALVDADQGRLLVVKGAPEAVLARCAPPPGPAVADRLGEQFAAGYRVIAVASRPASGMAAIGPADEQDLRLVGFLVFLDTPKPTARAALARLRDLGVEVKIVTGDNPVVAATVCAELDMPVAGVLTGAELDELDEAALLARIQTTTIFARVSPEQKARVIRAQRRTGADVAFLGDGVNDAVALHDADVGVSVESAVDVARDAADVILLDKDLGVLADGVAEGRRIFANTIKYVLMGTSSNFGNMFSAAGASAVLSFLPMLPSQILLNNLLYDSSQLAIPTDVVDPEMTARPSRWDIRQIQRFMLTFGPLSSVFDALTFVVMLAVFHAGPALFRSGWFVESLATQTLIVFVIRTRRSPFWRSRPSVTLATAVLAVVATGAILPFTPAARPLGFAPLPAGFFAALGLMVLAYLALVEFAKRRFFATRPAVRPVRERTPGHRVHRRAAPFSHPGRLAGK